MAKKKAKRPRGAKVLMVPGEDGRLVELVLMPAVGKGTMPMSQIRAAVRKVRAAKAKAKATQS